MGEAAEYEEKLLAGYYDEPPEWDDDDEDDGDDFQVWVKRPVCRHCEAGLIVQLGCETSCTCTAADHVLNGFRCPNGHGDPLDVEGERPFDDFDWDSIPDSFRPPATFPIPGVTAEIPERYRGAMIQWAAGWWDTRTGEVGFNDDEPHHHDEGERYDVPGTATHWWVNV